MYPSNKLSREEVISAFKKTWGDVYDYSDVEYVNNFTKVSVICRKHGKFTVTPKDHKRSNPSGSPTGCPGCFSKVRHTLDSFILKARNIHGEDYDYSKSVYSAYHSKIEVVCRAHKRSFYPTPANHISGTGCPLCKESRGEKI